MCSASGSLPNARRLLAGVSQVRIPLWACGESKETPRRPAAAAENWTPRRAADGQGACTSSSSDPDCRSDSSTRLVVSPPGVYLDRPSYDRPITGRAITSSASAHKQPLSCKRYSNCLLFSKGKSFRPVFARVNCNGASANLDRNVGLIGGVQRGKEELQQRSLQKGQTTLGKFLWGTMIGGPPDASRPEPTGSDDDMEEALSGNDVLQRQIFWNC
jgi:hypothetical protein